MWRKQIRAEQAAEQASRAVAKANALREAAMDRPGSSGNEGGPSEDVSDSEADTRGGGNGLVGPSLASRALVRAAENLRDSTPSVAGSNVDTLVDERGDENIADQDTSSDGKAGDAGPDPTRDRPPERQESPTQD
jgi:ATP-binding cassette, subfamily B, vacuolar membrane transporter HMT1/ACLQ